MPEDNRGFKRRLSDADASERITQRQMILNMSICKLQKDHGRKEPRLLRSLLIANTVRLIEQEMEDEEIQLGTFKGEDFIDSFENAFSDERDWATLEVLPTNEDELDPELKNADELRASFADIGTDIIPGSKKIEAGIQFESSGKTIGLASKLGSECGKFGAIGDHRKVKEKDDDITMLSYSNNSSSSNNNAQRENVPSSFPQMPALALALDLQMPVLSLPLAENSDPENCFSDLEMSCYDVDFVTSPVLSQICDEWKLLDGYHSAGPLSCASEVEKKRGDTFFDELDQIMQVLVSM